MTQEEVIEQWDNCNKPSSFHDTFFLLTEQKKGPHTERIPTLQIDLKNTYYLNRCLFKKMSLKCTRGRQMMEKWVFRQGGCHKKMLLRKKFKIQPFRS